MESPPSLPPKPLGRAFYILLVAPVASMMLAAALSVFKSSVGDLGVMLSLATLFVMLVCSIICAVMVGKCKGAGSGFLAFVGIQILYIGIAFAGCSTVMQVNFH